MKYQTVRTAQYCIFLCCITALFILIGKNALDRHELQKGIAEELIRFHVRANSNSEEDQLLKLKVRDSVIAYLNPLLAQSTSLEESRRIIEENTDALVRTAQRTIRENGYDYPVSAYFENTYFPVKTYGTVTLPAGTYNAFRMDIGRAAGRNWWCVLYPPLCFQDLTHVEMSEDSKEILRENLTKEEYDAVMKGERVVRFKSVDFLKNILR